MPIVDHVHGLITFKLLPTPLMVNLHGRVERLGV